MRKLSLLMLVLYAVSLHAQPNCEAYKYYGDEKKYQACKAAEKRAGHYQFSRKYQEALDEALAIDSTFAFAYRAKSTAYLKSGDFITWKALMDKAVQYDPYGQLSYRGWCRYQFFRDYQGAIEDIERLDEEVDYDIGHSVNGDYHLHIARALCYKAIGNPQRAVEIMKEQLQDSTHFLGIYDYLHLGVLYLEMGNYQEAITYLTQQADENDIAENRFYLALAFKQVGRINDYLTHLSMAKAKYEQERRMFDPYVEQMDKIYLADIENEIQIARQNGHDVQRGK